MMERLTKIGHKGYAMLKGSGCNYSHVSFDCQVDEGIELLKYALEKLAEYENAEEQGLLLRLPCKVGDVIYYVCDNRVMSSEVLSVKYHAEAENYGVFIRERLVVDFEGIPTEIDFNTIGKTVFLTQAEAEQKLKEMESD